MEGGDIVQVGEADAYGHQKLGGVGQLIGDKIKELTGEDIIYQQVAYLMRSGAPDSLDLMVAFNYAHMAMDMILKGQSGRMVALRGGVYTDIPISMIMQGRKVVDVGELYDIDQYRPKIRHVAGMPIIRHGHSREKYFPCRMAVSCTDFSAVDPYRLLRVIDFLIGIDRNPCWK
jgi:hypothetical protein